MIDRLIAAAFMLASRVYGLLHRPHRRKTLFSAGYRLPASKHRETCTTVVAMDQALWAALYVTLLEHGVFMCKTGAPAKHLCMLLDVLMPSIAAAAGNPEPLAALEAELRAISGE